MKTKKITGMVIFLLCFQQVIQAQNLNRKIERSLIEIGNTFPEIPKERLLQLDQVAFSLFKNALDGAKLDVLFIDKGYQEISQLAMIWLQTGLIYYGHHDMFNIRSAGITPGAKPLSGLTSLNEHGFRIKNTSSDHSVSYSVKYGSGSWVVHPKSLQDITINNENVVKIYVEEGAIDSNEDKGIGLPFPNENTVAREVLYITTRIDNLIKTKK